MLIDTEIKDEIREYIYAGAGMRINPQNRKGKIMRQTSGIRNFVLAIGLCGLTALGALSAAEAPAQPGAGALWQENFDRFERWRLEGPETLTAELDKEFSPGDTCLKYTFRIDDPTKGKAWPQQRRTLTPLPLDGNDCYFEFDAYYRPVKGEMKLRISMKELDEVWEPGFRLKPDEWTHVKVPVAGKKPGARLSGYAFTISRRKTGADSEAVFYIKNLRIVRGDRFEARPDTALRPGILSQKVTPAAGRPKDTRMEIEIPNLINNGYFRVGGKTLPPAGWGIYGEGVDALENVCSYGESYHDGHSLRLTGVKPGRIVVRQNGLVLIPGERYKLSGYLRGGDFTGKMEGRVVIASAGWSRERGYFFTEKDVKPDWQYFEIVFTPDASKSGEYNAILYRTGAGGGWFEVDRLILEPLSEKGLKESRNKYVDDDFDARYAKALKDGSFRQGPPSPDYKLVWSDEFDGDALNTDVWKVFAADFQGKRPYRLTPNAVKLDGKGHALFTASLAEDGKVEVPRIATAGRKSFTFGYFECRFKLHDSNFANASFWMLPEGRMDYRDPVHTGMEIDIFECILPLLNSLSHTTHWYSNVNGKKISFSGGTLGRTVPGLNKGWHTIALEWTPTDLIFYIDGVESWRLNEKDHPIPVNPHHLIFTFYGRCEEIVKQPGFKTTFMADYARVYQKEKTK